MHQASGQGAARNATPTRPLPVDLPDLCVQAGYAVKRQGNSWGGASCPRCNESSKQSNKFSVYVGRDGRWRFKCQACGVYGDTADFLALAKNISVAAALKELSADNPAATSWTKTSRIEAVPNTRSVSEQDAMGRVMGLLKAHAFDTGPRKYLSGRGISDAVMDMAMEKGQLRMLPTNPGRARQMLFELIGEEDLRASGLLKGGSRWPAIAFRPLIAIEPGVKGAEFRCIDAKPEGPKAIRYGNMQWPWYFKRVERPASVMVVEGFIDALSVIEGVPEAEAVMGVPGINGWKPRWFEALKEVSPDVMILIGFDNDKAGKEGVPKLADALDSLAIRNLVMLPPPGQDWNEALIARSFI